MKHTAKDYIPTMTHPLSSVWEQPSRDSILMDNTHAMMTEYTFNQLHTYSASIPTGAYEGKMWKAKYDTGWFLRWYAPSNIHDRLSIIAKKIILDT